MLIRKEEISERLAKERRLFFVQSLATALGGAAIVSESRTVFAQNPAPASGNPKTAEPSLSVHDHSMQWPPGWVGKEEIVMLLYPGFTALDVFGPHHMFTLMMGAKVHLVAKTLDPVKTDTNIEIKPTITFAECSKKPTLFFVPGGTAGTLDAAKDRETLAFVKELGGQSEWITSVCTGSVVLGAAGLLNGYKATSHWLIRDLLTEFGAIPTDQRVVIDRNRITGAGVTAGLDFGLQIIKDLRSQEYAEAVQLFAEYDPTPPIDKGSQAKADPQVSGLLMHMHEPFREMVRQVAKSN